MLSTKKGKEVYVEPVIEGNGYRFTVRVGKPKNIEEMKRGTKLARGANFRCLMSGEPIASDHIKTEGKAGRMGTRLMAIVAEGERERVYLMPASEMKSIALKAQPTWKPEVAMPENPRWFSPPLYGLKTYGDLFTPRQLVELTTFSDLVLEAHERAKHDAIAAGFSNSLINSGLDSDRIEGDDINASVYSDAIAIYLAFSVDKIAARSTTICSWEAGYQKIQHTFGRQAIPMIWDYAEGNPFSNSTGNFSALLKWIDKYLIKAPASVAGIANQSDAQVQSTSVDRVVSTDPPYYDNIGYADLSDFFYIWLRRSLKSIYSDLFYTLASPKVKELVATPYRHGSMAKAGEFFLLGMTRAIHRLAEQAHPAFPVTIYYAFKQSEVKKAGTVSTGWETFLDAVIRAGFAISGTWPMRTELGNRMVGMGTNALASSIILVCRQRKANASVATRHEFLTALKFKMQVALTHLQRGNIAPVDLAQAAIGPGMAVYTSYDRVLESDGNSLTVGTALALINQVLDEVLAEHEGDFDSDSRWALAWFEQSGFGEGDYGVAETLSKAKNTSVTGMTQAGILTSHAGKVRLLRPNELPNEWNPDTDKRLTSWEVVHHLIRSLEKGGEDAAGKLVARLGSKAEIARQLAYRLYTICERKKRTQEALSYNGLVQSWPEIIRMSREHSELSDQQQNFFS
jgi:putative DNA methylase